MQRLGLIDDVLERDRVCDELVVDDGFLLVCRIVGSKKTLATKREKLRESVVAIGREVLPDFLVTRFNHSSRMRPAVSGFPGLGVLRCLKMAGLLRSQRCRRGLCMQSKAITAADCG